MNITFQELDQDDLVECASLFVTTFKKSPWNENWKTEEAFDRLSNFIACPQTIALKAVIQGKVCGFLIGEIQHWTGDLTFYLKEICISPDYQRQGIGKKLMSELEHRAKAKNISSIYLVTYRRSNPSDFYAALGFGENRELQVVGKHLR